MNRTAWIVISVLVVLGLAGLVIVSKKDAVNVDGIDPYTVIQSTDGTIGDQTKGKKDAKVVVFEYADFQCPGCAGAHQNLPRIQALYEGSVLFVFRNFPLTSGHQNALAASTSAEAAGLQGKFWEMHDVLFSNQNEWQSLDAQKRNETFTAYAKQLGLNTDTFTNDLSNKAVQEKIRTDRALGAKVNVTETPTFIVNNEKVSSEIVTDLIQKGGDLFMDLLDAKLKEAGETPPARN